MLKFYFQIKDNFKKNKNNLLQPILNFLNKKFKVNANFLSFFGFLISLIGIYFLFENNLLFLIFILIGIFFDTLDGAMAKVEKKNKKSGWLIDMVLDRSVMVLILIKSLFFLDIKFLWLLIILYILVCVFYIYEKIIRKREIEIFFGDHIVYFIFAFEYYLFAICLRLILIILSFIELLFQMRKRKL